jgi:hypothetical protein
VSAKVTIALLVAACACLVVGLLSAAGYSDGDYREWVTGGLLAFMLSQLLGAPAR